eukprot:6918675-Alexandrium_andersonii.AAC.2
MVVCDKVLRKLLLADTPTAAAAPIASASSVRHHRGHAAGHARQEHPRQPVLLRGPGGRQLSGRPGLPADEPKLEGPWRGHVRTARRLRHVCAGPPEV